MSGTEINKLRAEIRVLIVSNFIVILVNLVCFSVFMTIYITGKDAPNSVAEDTSDAVISLESVE
jgi:hypothetical protein